MWAVLSGFLPKVTVWKEGVFRLRKGCMNRLLKVKGEEWPKKGAEQFSSKLKQV